MNESAPNPQPSPSAPGSTPPSSAASSPPTPRRSEKIHDFTGKLRHPAVLPKVVEYVAWRRALDAARAEGRADPATPALVPVSINLDLTMACNYKCDHCIDFDIINSPAKHDDDELRAAMLGMADQGLRSVILIGGGEPTLYPGFVGFVEFLKQLQLQVAVVSNGSRGDRLLAVAPVLTDGDWIRLSLDSGDSETFRRMHKPAKKDLSLDEICSWVPQIRAAAPGVDVGYSFIVTWRGGTREDAQIIENLDEIGAATRRARDAGFTYISFKPFLERAADGAEVLNPDAAEGDVRRVRERIVAQLNAARELESPDFRVLESTNLRLMVEGRSESAKAQPRTCHMQALRQVVSPLGTFNCPAYRGVGAARIGDGNAYRDQDAARETAAATKQQLDRFDASHRCREITCLYNETNWWLQEWIDSGEDLAGLVEAEDRPDTFL